MFKLFVFLGLLYYLFDHIRIENRLTWKKCTRTLVRIMLKRQLQWKRIHIYLALLWPLFILAGLNFVEFTTWSWCIKWSVSTSFFLFFFLSQARGSDEENYGDGYGRRWRIRSAFVPYNIPEVRSIRHTDDRVRLYAKLYVERGRLRHDVKVKLLALYRD